ncbi:hypothetical protein EVAR_59436_1 [Eumeta japonica]|uniref:Uncharacterized protein n=1 Tax=Eumeta variegata TaxID=151549 RepID=A0A4C1Z342_EUMVA|nr:hypothetical protein EVAR_59436_1 [Eumeta japonica]
MWQWTEGFSRKTDRRCEVNEERGISISDHEPAGYSSERPPVEWHEDSVNVEIRKKKFKRLRFRHASVPFKYAIDFRRTKQRNRFRYAKSISRQGESAFTHDRVRTRHNTSHDG